MTRKQESMIATAVATLTERSDRFEKALSAVAERLAAPAPANGTAKAEPAPIALSVETLKGVKYLVARGAVRGGSIWLNPRVCRALKAHGELIGQVAAQ